MSKGKTVLLQVYVTEKIKNKIKKLAKKHGTSLSEVVRDLLK